jgi:hypothetical protein
MYRSFKISKNGPTIYQGDDIADYAVPQEGDLWIQTDVAGLQQYTSGAWAPISAAGGGVSPSDLTTALNAALAPMADPKVLHVSKVTHSFTADGSPNKPFNTIQAAHNWAATNVNENAGGVVLLVHPGVYSENVTITRAKTHIRGLFGPQVVTAIAGNVVVNLTNSLGNWTNNRVSIEDIQITSASTGALVALSGANPIGFYMNRVKLFSSTAGQTLFLTNNTVGAGVRFEIDHCDIQTSSNAIAFDIANAAAGSVIRRTISETNTAAAMRFRSGSMAMEDTQIGTTGSQVAIQVDAGTLTLQRDTIYNTFANGDGLSLLGGTTSLGFSVINVPAGTGFAVRGVSGAVFAHATNVYQTNNKVSSAMGAGLVALTTTVSAV